jgi:hypothetical protein
MLPAKLEISDFNFIGPRFEENFLLALIGHYSLSSRPMDSADPGSIIAHLL